MNGITEQGLIAILHKLNNIIQLFLLHFGIKG